MQLAADGVGGGDYFPRHGEAPFRVFRQMHGRTVCALVAKQPDYGCFASGSPSRHYTLMRDRPVIPACVTPATVGCRVCAEHNTCGDA